jgi:hypothetical protein
MKICSAMLLVLSIVFSHLCIANNHLLSLRTRHLTYLTLLQQFDTMGYDQQKTIQYVSRRMNLSSDGAKSFLTYAENSYQQMERKNKDITRELLCPDQINLQYISENSEMLVDAIKDIQESYLYTAYSSILTDFDKTTFNSLNQWLDRLQPGTQSSTRPSGLKELITVCNQLALTNL